jgi:glyoxylase-like metal-dependent hydrolase (beta-lactamase superfamily II)
MKRWEHQVVMQWDGGAAVRLQGKFSNLYILASSDRAVLVDTCTPSDSAAAVQYWERRQDLGATRIDLIVLTHLHIDHVAGTTTAAKHSGAPVAASEHMRPYLEGQRIPAPSLRELLCVVVPIWLRQGASLPSRFDWANACLAGFPLLRTRLRPSPSVWLRDGDDIPVLPDWRVLHSPGHTSDSICLLNERQGILVSGDTVLNLLGTGEYNRIVADDSAMERTIARIGALELRAVLPGHGDPLLGDNVASHIARTCPCLLLPRCCSSR